MESDGCEGVGNMLEWVNRSAGGAHRRGRRSGRDETIAEKHEDADTHIACATEPSALGRRRANGECPEYHGTSVPRDPHDAVSPCASSTMIRMRSPTINRPNGRGERMTFTKSVTCAEPVNALEATPRAAPLRRVHIPTFLRYPLQAPRLDDGLAGVIT